MESAYAVTGSVPAIVEVFEEITIEETTPLSFGSILAPSGASQTFTINPEGTTNKGAGDGDFLADQQQGVISFFGKDGAMFNILVTPGSCTGFIGTVTLVNIIVSSNTGILDTSVQVGGTVEVGAFANGSGFCVYTVSAGYQ